MKRAVQNAVRAGAEGIRVSCAGRLGGAEMARREWYREGRVPLHTLRADIDYGMAQALTTFGRIGVKVWIYKGEIRKLQRAAEAVEEKGPAREVPLAAPAKEKPAEEPEPVIAAGMDEPAVEEPMAQEAADTEPVGAESPQTEAGLGEEP